MSDADLFVERKCTRFARHLAAEAMHRGIIDKAAESDLLDLIEELRLNGHAS